MCFSDPLSSNFISTVSKYGHIRLYDVRSGQRRPVIDLNWTDEALTAISATPNKDQVNKIKLDTNGIQWDHNTPFQSPFFYSHI